MIGRFFFFALVALGTLLWRFPYDRFLADRVARLEAQTGVQLDYTPVKASIFGVEWKDVRLSTPSGAKASFQQAKLRPTFQGLSAYLAQQGNNHARVSSNRRGELEIKANNLEIDTGTREYGRVTLTGDLVHRVSDRRGEGQLGVQLPDYKIPLGVADITVQVGSKLFWQDRGRGYELRAELVLTAGNDYHADGNLLAEPQVGGPALVNGNLVFRTPLKEGKLRVFGPWKQLQWSVLPK